MSHKATSSIPISAQQSSDVLLSQSNAPEFTAQKIILTASVAAMFALLIWFMQPVLLPLIMACVMYSLLEPLTNRLIGDHYSQLMAITVVLVGILCLLVIVLTMFIPVIFDQVLELQAQFPVMMQSINEHVQTFNRWFSTTTKFTLDTVNISDKWLGNLQELGANAVMTSANVIMQLAMVIVLVPLILFFLLRDYRKIRNNVMSMLPNDKFEIAWITYHRVTQQLQRYVKGVVTQSILIAIIATTGFYSVGLDKAILFGCLTGVLNIIPYVGPLIAASLPLFVSITAGTFDLWVAVGVVGVILLVQVIDNVFIVPSIIANSIGLHPLVVLFGVIIFGSFFGLIGMLLAIPLMASVKIVIQGLLGRFKIREIEP